MLRNEIGDRAFFDALRAYYAAHKHATATTDDLRAAMEREAKRPMIWFFDQWLRRPGFPSVTAEWSYDGGAKEVAITVSQGSAFGNFQFPLTVAVIDSAGGQHRATLTMPATGAVGTLRVPLATAPANVVLDPDVDLLAQLQVIRR
jgi:aminopeptidase N